jgi:two-component system response regulator YesN
MKSRTFGREAGETMNDTTRSSPINLLVVDDSLTYLEMFSRTVKLCSLPIGRTIRARTAEEALFVLRNEPIDVLFTDIHMPGMDGLELISQVRLEEKCRNLKIVVVTADYGTHLMSDLFDRRVNALIGKPVTPESIRNAIERALESCHVSPQ